MTVHVKNTQKVKFKVIPFLLDPEHSLFTKISSLKEPVFTI